MSSYHRSRDNYVLGRVDLVIFPHAKRNSDDIHSAKEVAINKVVINFLTNNSYILSNHQVQ
jgi:hypothetical protein